MKIVLWICSALFLAVTNANGSNEDKHPAETAAPEANNTSAFFTIKATIDSLDETFKENGAISKENEELRTYLKALISGGFFTKDNGLPPFISELKETDEEDDDEDDDDSSLDENWLEIKEPAAIEVA